MRRLVLFLLVVAAAVPTVALDHRTAVSAAQVVGSSSCPSATVYQGATGTWTVYEVPALVDEARITAHAVDPVDPRRWYLTDGTSVLRSPDGGCTWDESFRLPSALPPEVARLAGTDPSQLVLRITHIEVARTPGHSDRVFLTAAAHPATAFGFALHLAVVLWRSDDAGRTWEQVAAMATSGATISAPGDHPVSRTAIAPSDPDVVYALAGGLLYASDDGGSTWEQRNLPVNPASWRNHRPGPHPIDDIAVDPLEAEELWARTGILAHSTDGGRSWRAHPASRAFGGSFYTRGPDVQHRPGEPSRVLVVAAHLGVYLDAYLVSEDGGHTVVEHATADYGGKIAAAPQSLAHGRERDDRVYVTRRHLVAYPQESIWRFDPVSRRFVSLDEFGLSPVADVQSDLAPTTRFYFRRARDVVVYDSSQGPGGDPGAGGGSVAPGSNPVPEHVQDHEPCPDGTVPPAPREPEPTRLRADPSTVTLPAGGQTTIDAVLEVPPRPSPIDVFFLVDTSNSMGDEIDSLRDTLAEAAANLAARDLDVHAGLGEYNDALTRAAYRRLVDIGPIDCRIPRALDGIEVGGMFEHHLLALEQVVTGAGSARVAPGGQATFRPGARRLVLHATDEPFDPNFVEPTRDVVGAAYRAAGVLHIGLNALAAWQAETRAAPSDVRADLDDMARRTGALAPEGGIDCDGNGLTDIPEGEPVTCDVGGLLATTGFYGGNIGRVVTEVVSAMRSTAMVRLAARAPAGVQVEVLDPEREVDLAEHSTVRYQVRITCPAAGEGTGPHTIELDASTPAEQLANAMATVTCGAAAGTVPAEPAEPSPAPGAPEPANPTQPSPATPAPSPPPPVPVPATGPAPVPATGPAPAAGPSVAASQVANPAGAGAPAPAAGTAQGTAPVAGTAPGAAQGIAPAASPGAAPAPGGSPAQVAAAPGGGGASPALSWGDAGRRAPPEAATVHDAANARTAAATLLMAGTSLLLRRHRAAGRLHLARNRR
jgi:photosystem II stability/assembly factor-like uncharacterized protein